MDSRKCQTVTATPAKPGELPVGLDMPVRIYRKFTSEPREKKTREIFLTRHIWGFQLKCGYEVVLLIDSSVVSSKFFAF
jgi:hypothetical protein